MYPAGDTQNPPAGETQNPPAGDTQNPPAGDSWCNGICLGFVYMCTVCLGQKLYVNLFFRTSSDSSSFYSEIQIIYYFMSFHQCGYSENVPNSGQFTMERATLFQK